MTNQIQMSKMFYTWHVVLLNHVLKLYKILFKSATFCGDTKKVFQSIFLVEVLISKVRGGC